MDGLGTKFVKLTKVSSRLWWSTSELHHENNEFPYPKISMGFLEIYVSMTTLKGETFAIESSNVHTIITKFISGKNESK